MIVGRDEQLVALASALDRPGLAVLTGGPGAGKTTLARAAANQAGRQVLTAGALSSLRAVPALPLSRAIRAAVPVDDPSLAVEAVRIRLGDAVLLLDDAHWADRFTLSLLPELARYCPVVATVRLPGLPGPAGPAIGALRPVASYWCDLPPLPDEAAARVVRQVRSDLPDPVVRRLVGRCGGNPLALRVLARAGEARPDLEPLRGVAELVADLPQPERTALAALGLLGRPAPAALLGPGWSGLVRDGLAALDAELVAPTERFVAEVAAGVLPDGPRRALHRRLAALVGDDGEAARHLAAAGDRAEAADRALRAAGTAGGEQRAGHLHFAVTCLGDRADPGLVLDAAEAALDTGQPARCGQLVEPLTPADPAGRARRAVLLSESLTRRGEPARAGEVLRPLAAELPGLDPALRARYAVASVYAALADDPEVACALAEYPLAEFGPAAPPRLWAAYGAALLGAGRPGWQEAVRTALDGARKSGDLAGECAAGAVLVTALRDGCRPAEARALATELADRAAGQGAYSLEVTFRVESLWAALVADGVSDGLVRSGLALLDRSAPVGVRALLAATVGLAQADAGAIPAARALLRDSWVGAGGADRLARWVAAETAWLDGDPVGSAAMASPLTRPGRHTEPGAEPTSEPAAELPASDPPADLPADLARLTLAWCTAAGTTTAGYGDGDRDPVRATLAAWTAADPGAFRHAAEEWRGVMVRERVRCLLAAAESGGDLDCLLSAEREAEQAGLVLLLGRVRRALRQRGVTRGPTHPPRPTRPTRPTGPAGPGGLSAREYQTLALVGQGHSTRRIAELLGLTRNTTETYIKQAMSKLGARTRTEAAVRASTLAGGVLPEPAPTKITPADPVGPR